MTSVLFVTWDGGGNVPPALAIAREVMAAGGSARVLGHERQRAAVERSGVRFDAYSTARAWSILTPRSGLTGDLQYAAVFADRALGRDVVESLRTEPTDRVVVDGLLVGAMAELDAAGIPYVILVHTVRSVMYRRLVSPPLGAVLGIRGLRPERLYARAAAEIVASEPTLDAGASAAPRRARYVGAVIPGAAASAAPERPRVLVSLSTTYVAAQTAALRRIIDAMAALSVDTVVETIVTTGPAVDPGALGPVPPGVVVSEFVPHEHVLPHSSLVIGHGGHATTMAALAHGLPLLVMPMNSSFDQPAIGRLVRDNGLGLTLPRRASTSQIADAVGRLLSDDSSRRAAESIGAVMRTRRAASDAAALLADPTPR